MCHAVSVICGQFLEPPAEEDEHLRFTVDEDRCTLCGLCINACPADMVREKRGAIKISPVACIGCGHCMAICPENAVALEELEYEGHFELQPSPSLSPGELLGLIKARRSVRRYLPDPVPREDLELLLEAARYVPTAANCQCQEFIVITDGTAQDRLRDRIADYYRAYAQALADRNHPGKVAFFGSAESGQMHEHLLAAVPSFVKSVDAGRDRLFFGATAVILVHAAEQEVLPETACAFATLAIVLTAQTLGLGTCITAYASLALQALPELAHELGIPDGNRVYYVVVVGKPGEEYRLVPPREPPQVKWV